MSTEIGFSLWLDFIERDYLKQKFKKLLDEGVVTGATSNPAIFASAITTSPAYREQLNSLENRSPKEKYEALAIEDIRLASRLLRPLYDANRDGYISIEVDPSLSGDSEATVAEARRLFLAIGEPNVMLKIPATPAGYEATSELMAMGISVNATLVFSPQQAQECIKAMREGIAKGEQYGSCKVDGVISVFVSRFDRALDNKLEAKGVESAKTGIYNAKRIYNLIESYNIPNIRTLFASTGVKGDNLPKDYYITNLVAPHSINTAPLNTIQAYLETDNREVAFPLSDEVIAKHFAILKEGGFDMEELYSKLLKEGLRAFEKAFEDMLAKLR
jgi:transaldolase